jgi:hypothetical protein
MRNREPLHFAPTKSSKEASRSRRWRALTTVVALLASVLGLLLSIPDLLPPPFDLLEKPVFKGAYENSPSPSVDAVFSYVRRGDLAFERREYGEAFRLYTFALLYLEEMEAIDAPQEAASDGVPTYRYLRSAVKVRLRLAELGMRINNDSKVPV